MADPSAPAEVGRSEADFMIFFGYTLHPPTHPQTHMEVVKNNPAHKKKKPTKLWVLHWRLFFYLYVSFDIKCVIGASNRHRRRLWVH